MLKIFIPVLVSALLFFPVGFILGSTSAESSDETADHSHAPGTPEDHTHSTDGQPVATHIHGELFDASELEATPTLSDLSVVEDEKSGWNLSFTTDNFTFTPENVNQDHVDNEGHAHIEVNGERLARIYSHDFHIDSDALKEGANTVTVSLNTNKHLEYAIDGQPIEVQMTIQN